MFKRRCGRVCLMSLATMFREVRFILDFGKKRLYE